MRDRTRMLNHVVQARHTVWYYVSPKNPFDISDRTTNFVETGPEKTFERGEQSWKLKSFWVFLTSGNKQLYS